MNTVERLVLETLCCEKPPYGAWSLEKIYSCIKAPGVTYSKVVTAVKRLREKNILSRSSDDYEPNEKAVFMIAVDMRNVPEYKKIVELYRERYGEEWDHKVKEWNAFAPLPEWRARGLWGSMHDR